VAGGLGRYFGVDPIIFRIVFVVLAFASGAGLLAYIGFVIAVPSDSPSAPSRSRAAVGLGVGVLVLALIAVLPGSADLGPAEIFWFGPGLIGFALIAALGVVLWRASRDGGDDPGRRVLRAMLALVAVFGALCLGTAAAIAVAAGAGVVVSILVIAAGVGLSIAAFAGGARWLIVPALVLATPLALVAASDIDIRGGVGERVHRPVAVTDIKPMYRLGVGQLDIDLRDVQLPDGATTLNIDLGVGDARVLLPAGVCVDTKATVGAGMVDVLGHESSGLDVQYDKSGAVGRSAKRLSIQADIGVGALEVGTSRSGFGDGHGPLTFDSTADAATACTPA
jgi:phage shock protein PspC (stress-responsive transcriptional regulator)